MEFSTGEKRMQAIRNLGLALAVLFVAGCASFTGDTSPNLPRNCAVGHRADGQLFADAAGR